jgi:hypothetical protein
MDPSNPVKIITTALTDDAIMARLGVTKHAIRAARRFGSFPASWYAPLADMCERAGIECPIEAFNWRTPSQGDAT